MCKEDIIDLSVDDETPALPAEPNGETKEEKEDIEPNGEVREEEITTPEIIEAKEAPAEPADKTKILPTKEEVEKEMVPAAPVWQSVDGQPVDEKSPIVAEDEPESPAADTDEKTGPMAGDKTGPIEVPDPPTGPLEQTADATKQIIHTWDAVGVQPTFHIEKKDSTGPVTVKDDREIDDPEEPADIGGTTKTVLPFGKTVVDPATKSFTPQDKSTTPAAGKEEPLFRFRSEPLSEPETEWQKAEKRRIEFERKRAERSRAQQRASMEEGDKPEDGSDMKRAWKTAVAMAIVCGLIAGSLTYGVARATGNLVQMAGKDTVVEKGSPQHVELAVPEESRTTTPTISFENSKSVAQVTADTLPAMVTISTMSVQEMLSFFGIEEYEAEGAGTGVIVGENDDELLIATNHHVVSGANEVSVGFIDEKVVSAQIKGSDSKNDLCVLAVKKADIPKETMSKITIATIGDSDSLVLGEQVVAIGNALGEGQSVTSGYVSGLNRELELYDGDTMFVSSGLIQTDAAINSGNSGGALLNMKGELVGINEAKSAYSSGGVAVDNVAYAIPMSRAKPILEDLMNKETREQIDEEARGYLGVSCADVGMEAVQTLGMPEGVCFIDIAEKGPAAKAGAIRGDILTRIGDAKVTSVKDLQQEMRFYGAGDTVEIAVFRADNGEYKEHVLKVTLGEEDVLDHLAAG